MIVPTGKELVADGIRGESGRVTIQRRCHMLTPGTRLGPFEVISTIGIGGMGEVYRARDTRLKREVALKLLPDRVANDPERVARFQREAELLAALSHPHIATLFGVEELPGAEGTPGADGTMTRALVMELVEGETLAERLERGPVAVDEALPIARQLADALDYAHEHGVLHRDLKPANVKITLDDSVKILDFGLAKVLDGVGAAGRAGAHADLSHSPTITSPLAMTGAGVVLGTAAYMAPEQARGHAVDKRSDIWAFGTVLYELLTGTRAFPGETISDTLAAVLKAEPDWTKLPASTPVAVRTLLERCLDRNTRTRLRDIGDAMSSLREEASAQPAAAPSQRRGGIGLLAATAAAIVAALIGASGAWLVTRRAGSAGNNDAPRPVRRATVRLPDGVRLSDYAEPGPIAQITKDGKKVVFVGFKGAETLLFVHDLEQGTTTALPGTGNARGAFLSPDGTAVAYYSGQSPPIGGRLVRLLLTGGSPTPPLQASGQRAGTWLPNDDFVLTPNVSGPVDAVTSVGKHSLLLQPHGGGNPVPLDSSTLAEGEAHFFPDALPNGSAFVVTAREGSPQRPQWSVKLVESSGATRKLVDGAYGGRYATSGHLLFTTGQNRLMAQRLDSERRNLSGVPALIVSDLQTSATDGTPQFSVSDEGTLIYVTGDSDRTNRQPVWVSREGRESTFTPLKGNYAGAALSPRGDSAVLSTTGGTALTLLDAVRGTPTTVARPSNVVSIHSASWIDDRRIVFTRRGSENVSEIWETDVRSGEQRRLFTPDGQGTLRWASASTNGVIVFAYSTSATNMDVWVGSLMEPAKARPWLSTPAREDTPAVSPDGRLIAYVSNESGRFEVYVGRTDGAASTKRISADGGLEPLFARSGRELFFRRGDDVLAADVKIERDEIVVGPPHVLFTSDRYERRSEPPGRAWDVSPDGTRFLMFKNDLDRGDEIRVIFNFFDELRSKLP